MTDDEELASHFEHCTLPKEQWTHSAHVRIAYLHLLRLSVAEAMDKLRRGIQALNAAHGVVDSPTRGYHETMTQAWLCLIAVTLKEHGPAESSEAFLNSQPHLRQSNVLQQYYSRERLMSAEAKVRFVEPNLAPLPHAPQ